MKVEKKFPDDKIFSIKDVKLCRCFDDGAKKEAKCEFFKGSPNKETKLKELKNVNQINNIGSTRVYTRTKDGLYIWFKKPSVCSWVEHAFEHSLEIYCEED